MAYTSNSSGSDTELGLESVEAQLIVYQKNEVIYEEKITVLEFEVKDKRYGDQLNENDSSGSELLNSVFDSLLSDGYDNQTNNRFKKDNGYHDVPPPLTGNYMPPLADLSFAGLDDSVYRPTANKTSASVPSGVIIEDWVSDDEDIFQSNDLQATDKPSFKRIKFTNARNESVKPKQDEKPRIITQNPKVDRRDWNGKNNSKTQSHSPIRRPFYKSTSSNTRISNEKVNTVRVNGVNTTGQTAVSTVKGTRVTAVKASAGCVWRPKMTDLNNVSKDNSGSWVSKRGNPQQALKNKGIFDIGCSKHMTRNKDFLTDYQELDGGFVAFGGSARGGKITGKGKIRTDKLEFKDVFFVKELKFNLFSVSQMCDNKNSVIFTETECLVLSLDFKLLDESQVLLRVPRQSNMYSFDLKNVVPSRDLTCLFAKAITDESNLWHREGKATQTSVMPNIVTDDFRRFSWVFFLASKDETSRILKRFITEIENQLNHKLGLADSLLPTVFWAEAVNTACYVLNRVLVTKPHNKTPYELIIGRPPNISFMRPFGCPVTILNTLDPLGKFDGKAAKGFLVGESNKNAGLQEANGDSGLKKSVDDRQSEEKNMSTQQYIVFLLWSSISSSYKSSDEMYKNDTADDAAGETPV
ncbi:ribonuclease H-like domain-containing protein [Tanacetum coccineum]